jgi:hypothetical protein
MKKLVYVALMVALSVPAYAAQTQKSKRSSSASRRASPSGELSTIQREEYSSSSESHVQLRPLIAYNFTNPKGLNSTLSSAVANQTNSAFKVGSAMSFGVAADYGLTNEFSVGARVEYLSSSSDSVKLNNGLTVQASVGALPVYLTGGYKTSIAPRWITGGTLGVGLPMSFHGSLDQSGSNNPAVPNGTETYAATPFTGLASTFIGYEVRNSLSIRLEAGYRLLSSNQLKLTENFGTKKEGDILVDQQTNTNVKVDLSSFFTGLSMAIQL